MKKNALILLVLVLVIATGCVGGGGEEAEPGDTDPLDTDTDTGTGDTGANEDNESPESTDPSYTDTDTDANEDGDGSGGDEDETETGAPEPYTDAEVAFVVDGEERGWLSVEIANSTTEWEEGLMNRDSLPNGTGMLFVYPPNTGQRRFWMKNTLVPLDMIFVDSNGRVVNVEHASPGFEGERSCSNPDYYCSDGPAQFVVEAERGYANETGLSPGDRLIVDLR